jgi:hypothetical protein
VVFMRGAVATFLEVVLRWVWQKLSLPGIGTLFGASAKPDRDVQTSTGCWLATSFWICVEVWALEHSGSRSFVGVTHAHEAGRLAHGYSSCSTQSPQRRNALSSKKRCNAFGSPPRKSQQRKTRPQIEEASNSTRFRHGATLSFQHSSAGYGLP